ncbi:MAG: hypothetical protein HYY13_06585 [Nitrospirae bacterium]|nr:hypothetical protein [Nitrospirota bacterium]
MWWAYLANLAAFVVVATLFWRLRKKSRAAEDAADEAALDDAPPDLKGAQDLRKRLSEFIPMWEGEMERFEKQAASRLMEPKAILKEAKSNHQRFEAQIERERQEWTRSEEESEREVAQRFQGAFEKAPAEPGPLAWARQEAAYPQYGRAASAPAAPPEKPATAAPAPKAAAPAPTRPARPAAQPWKPAKVFAS